MGSIRDDRGYNQGFKLVKSTEVRMSRRADWILSEMSREENINVLEIGCGTGEIAHWIAERSRAQVLGTDLCVPFIDDAKQKYQLPNLQYAVLDFHHADAFGGEQFDYIVGNGILHHLYNHLDEALARMFALLKKGGKIIFIEPNLYNLYVYFIFSYPRLRKLAKLEPDEMAFSKSFILKKLHKAGYGDVRASHKDFLIPGVPDFLIQPSIVIGDVLEQIPLLKSTSQSLFICAEKK